MTKAGSNAHRELIGGIHKAAEKPLIPIGLADSITREILCLLNSDFGQEEGVRLGLTLGVLKWGKKNADKSGG